MASSVHSWPLLRKRVAHGWQDCQSDCPAPPCQIPAGPDHPGELIRDGLETPASAALEGREPSREQWLVKLLARPDQRLQLGWDQPTNSKGLVMLKKRRKRDGFAESCYGILATVT